MEGIFENFWFNFTINLQMKKLKFIDLFAIK